MQWEKLGHIYCPSGEFPWMMSHAANPFGIFQSSGVFRVYFSPRDAENRSHITFVDTDPENGFSVVSVSPQPVVSPGEPGLFDDSGVSLGYILDVNEKEYLYYLGWNLKVTVPWLNSIGLAIRNKGNEAFKKYSRAPIVDRSDEDPFSISYPSVLHENGKYRMWYGSNLRWGSTEEEMAHVIKYAESADGIRWTRSDRVVLGFVHENEYALSKPFVLRLTGGYLMFYSYRASGSITTYRIGHALSRDGLNWTRKDDETGIDISAAGWDSEMICYPFVFRCNSDVYMFYNGNGYGKSGFGLAKLVGDLPAQL